MKKSRIMTLFLLIMITLSVFPQSGSAAGSGDTAGKSPGDGSSAETVVQKMRAVLGLTLEELIDTQGLPDDLYPLRGPTPGQDSVVFYYSDSFTYYLADGHVWQVRADRNDLFQGDKLGLGLSSGDVKSIMGDPQRSGDDYSIYSLIRSGFPVAAAFYFDGGLSDLYVYRSDF